MLENETGLAEETAQAMRELASTVTDAPPLKLSPRPRTRASRPFRAPRPFGRRSWQLWGVPLAAGVAVVALAISPVVIKDLRSGPVVVAPPGPATVSGVPPYYVTLYSPPGPTSTSPPIPTATPSSQPTGAPCTVGSPGCSAEAAGGTDLLVGDTLTGAKLAVVAPPKGASFYGVTGAANDRTFVVDTYASGSVSDFALPRTFYRLEIVPGAKSPVQLTRLPLPSMTGTFAMALSQSGTELAVARMSSKLNDDETWLQIYSVATGRLLRSWSTDNPYVFERGADVMSDSNYGLTWVDGDRAVDFPYNYQSTGPLTTIKIAGRTFRRRLFTRHLAVRTLNVSASGGNLIADSRILWSEVPPETDGYSSGGCSESQDALVSADGETVMCTSSYGPDTGRPAGKIVPWHLGWLATSVAAPKTARPVYAFTIDAPIGAQGWLFALWSNASGTTMIGSWYFGTSQTPPVHFGVMSHGTFRALPVPPTIIVGGATPTIAW
jgi:hypothetical protein